MLRHSRLWLATGGLVLALASRVGATAEREARPVPPPVPAPEPFVPRRLEFERFADAVYGGMNPYLGRGPARVLEQQLSRTDLSASQRRTLLERLAMVLLRDNRLDEALARCEQADALLDAAEPPAARARLHELRGLTYLRMAETRNCAEHHNTDSCIFPLRGGAIHTDREPARLARQAYEKALALEPGNLRARWLLNIVGMALGEWPGGLPEELRIPPEALASDHDIKRFPDIAPRLGLATFDLAGGAILEDFDNDGLLDVMTSTSDPRGPLRHHRNRGDGRFEDVAAASRADDQLGGLNCNAADFDNDGRRDVLVLRGGWMGQDGKIRPSLLRNLPDGTFLDVTHRAGLAEPAWPTQAAAWADLDNDGDLDLYVGRESSEELAPGEGDYASQLFRNNGDGTFTDVAALAGVANHRFCKGVAAGDYDNDGDMDLYVSNIGRNRLYRNDGGLKFTDVAAETGVTEPSGRSFATWFFDYDNDGRLDLWVGAYQANVEDVAADVLGLPHKGKLPRLYHNEGGGRFADVTARAGLDHVWLPMGANFGDLDNDGWLDFYLGTGEPDFRALMPNVMLRNDGKGRFQDVTESGGFGHLQKGHGVAFGDLDHDGDQDILHQLGGFYSGDRFYSVLFQNPGHGNRYLFVKLVGTRSNRDAIGARLRVVVEEGERTREIHRAVGSVSSYGSSPIRQEIGLGAATRIRLVEVAWPASGIRSVIEDAPIDAMIRITEGHEGFERVELRRVPLVP